MQTKFFFQYLYGPCCSEVGSLFWWKFLVLLKNSASWTIHPLCVQQAAFSISLVKILLAAASSAGTHTPMQMKNDADWDLADRSCRFQDKEQNWMLQNMRLISSRCQAGYHISTLWRDTAIIDVQAGLCQQHSSLYQENAFLGAGSWISNSIYENNLVLEKLLEK